MIEHANGARLIKGARDLSIELKAWRAAVGYSAARAAEILGVPSRLYDSWEAGTPCAFAHMVETAIGLPVSPHRFEH
jgi:hypothetical protein